MKVASIALSVILLASFLALAFFIRPVKLEQLTWTVDGDGSADFNKIQEAINAAKPGDTIYVKTGTYYENVVVNKTVLLVGQDRDTTIIDSNGTGDTLRVVANNVTVTGFTIQGSTNYGLILAGTKNSFIYGNLVKNNHWGFFSRGSSNTIVENNTVVNNTAGIQINDSNEFFLRNNNITRNKYNFGVWGEPLSSFIHDIDTSNRVDKKPIYYFVNERDKNVPPDAGFVAVVNSTNITVNGLTLTNNSAGVLFAYTTQSRIEDVSVAGNAYGIELTFSDGNIVRENTVTSCDVQGIPLYYSKNNTVSLNVLANNSYGIDLQQSDNSIIAHNYVENGSYGILVSGGQNNNLTANVVKNVKAGGSAISLESANAKVVGNTLESNALGLSISDYHGSTYTIYHNNFVNNTKQVQLVNNPSVIWDNGYPSGGNYWSDYAGNDTNGDGIGDTPYVIDSNNRDRYPLMTPFLIGSQTRELLPTWIVVIIAIIAAVFIAFLVYFLKIKKTTAKLKQPFDIEDKTQAGVSKPGLRSRA
jgi:parallel beta-helix repeat protein